VEKYGTARHANIIQCMGFACRLTEATDTRSECVLLIVFPQHNGYVNVLQCYIVCILPIMLMFRAVTIFPYFQL
jgi:hypothetical protein